VHGLSLGESDLRSQTGALEVGLDWARGRIVNAAVAAGLPRPPQSVYPHVRDLEGLARSCRRGRALGHLGRAAIHPDQLPVIEEAYLPTRAEVDAARATIEQVESAGAGTLAGGAFVDEAMLGAARQVVELAARYG
jgi:citrate lyase subunit beta / citryl-CoA lyase